MSKARSVPGMDEQHLPGGRGAVHTDDQATLRIHKSVGEAPY